MPQNLVHTFKRYRTLSTGKISVLPIAILMPHSACNCRCIMCDIWKGNRNSRQLSEADVSAVLESLTKLDTKRVLMSGGEALLNKDFFTFCDLIRKRGIRITLLSTGMTIGRHAEKITEKVDEVILSLDGDQKLHDQIRNIPGAFQELKSGVQKILSLQPSYNISGRCVIHRHNYKSWHKIILAAKEIGLKRISFLAADVTSEAFNREQQWDKDRQQSVLIPAEELDELKDMIKMLVADFSILFESGFIAESPAKLMNIFEYYSAHHGRGAFPVKKCNAPWVSAVVEADGTVKPCFFHDALGTIRDNSLFEILNSAESIAYRNQLDTATNPTCAKCVCFLNLTPRNSQY